MDIFLNTGAAAQEGQCREHQSLRNDLFLINAMQDHRRTVQCEQVQRVGRLRTHSHVQCAVPTRLCDSGDLKEERFALYVAGALAGKEIGVTMMVEKQKMFKQWDLEVRTDAREVLEAGQER